jgi:GGDEF domain-containing protein
VSDVPGSQTCPTCGNALDPMHAPVARIRGGKVVSFCSAECAAAAPAEETRRPRASIPALPRQPEPAPAVPAPRGRETPAPRVIEAPAPRAKETAAPRAVETPKQSAADARRARMPVSRDYLAVEAAEPIRRPPPRSRGIVLAICAIVLAAGVALLVTEVLPLDGTEVLEQEAESPVRASAGSTAARRAPMTGAGARAVGASSAAAESAQPTGDAESRRAAAMSQLRSLMESGSARVRRLAAQALARTGDEAALALLRRMLGEEPSQLGRIRIAYALARAGDKPAREILRGQLAAERRDTRLDAARSLVQLGDDSGRKALRSMLGIASHRVGAAGLLARLGDDEGLKVLRAEASERRASAEARMRAQVALGRAGEDSVKGALREILADRRYNVGAADALAALGDDAATPALTAQLGLSAMRVQAALWLRRMKKQVDQEPLVAALEGGDEASRVSAAEALLILSGPPALAKYD